MRTSYAQSECTCIEEKKKSQTTIECSEVIVKYDISEITHRNAYVSAGKSDEMHSFKQFHENRLFKLMVLSEATTPHFPFISYRNEMSMTNDHKQ